MSGVTLDAVLAAATRLAGTTADARLSIYEYWVCSDSEELSPNFAAALEQFHARRLEARARADSAITEKPGGPMPTSIEDLERQLAALKRQAATFKPGEIKAIVTNDASGRPITRYTGDPAACWAQFAPPVRFVRQFLTPGRR